jgi:non-heme chloroperoxidase
VRVVAARRHEPPRPDAPPELKGARMPYVTTGSENEGEINIYYEDHGTGQPVVLIHGYPLNSDSWERQETELLREGYRVVRYDRRGFGNSSRPTTGYDYDTFAADLNVLLAYLALEDVVLVGFSMGTGEVARYLGTYGSARVRKAVMFGAIPPFLRKTDDNPEGVDNQVFEDIKASIAKDRYAYFKDFLDNFYNVDKLAPERISEQAWQASFNVAAGATPHASYVCVDAWLTDFRADVAKIDVPMLVLHGTEDRILPFEATAKRLPDLVPNLKLIPVEGGPHNIGWTHPEVVNKPFLDFLAEDTGPDKGLDRDLTSVAKSKS